jgi:hypothetical protein
MESESVRVVRGIRVVRVLVLIPACVARDMGGCSENGYQQF